MAGRVLVTMIRRAKPSQVRFYSHAEDIPPLNYKIGNREVVGNGLNGEWAYLDLEECPMPAIRFKEITPELKVLREKERGDWKKLTLQEKKDLYRASFCQTFVEMDAPTGEWKSILAGVLGVVGTAFLLYSGVKVFVHPPLPITFTEEYQVAAFERMRQIDMNPIHGMNKRNW